MASPSWQERRLEEASIPAARLPVNTAKKFFAVDCSGSTSGAIMRAQQHFVQGLHSNPKDQVTKWNHSCQDPALVDCSPVSYYSGLGGTSPENIARNAKTVKAIKESELWILLTDGEVTTNQVTELAELANSVDFIQVLVIFLITGSRYSTPKDTNISVGIPFFATAREGLILFKDYASGQIFVIDAKGAFEPLRTTQTDRKAEHGVKEEWNSLPMYPDEAAFCEACGSLAIDFQHQSDRRSLKSVSLGLQWATVTNDALVNVSELLKQRHIATPELRNLLEDEAVNQLALICKTRGQIGDLRSLFLRHKQQEVVVRLEDRHGASKIMERIRTTGTSSEKHQLLAQLREAHARNRDTYRRLKDSPSEESRLATEINRSVNRVLAILSEYEKSSYTADILNRKSNRAMHAGVVSAADAEIYVLALELSDTMDACRGTCSICCGEDQIMSIVLKELQTAEENTTYFALNFPLAAGWSKHNKDVVSSQCICFQCALLLERSIFHEKIVAKIPAVSYEGPNKEYIQHQLYLALTAGLSTGAPGIIQLFCTVLNRTLETKSWCSDPNTADPEIAARRNVLKWPLWDLLQKCPCRENLSETGRWVQYPEALNWAAQDYANAGLDSWIIQYPVAGFNQLLQWYSILDTPCNTPIERIKKAKLIHLTATAIMNGLRDEKNGDKSWTHSFLQLIYKGFNAPGVPRDLGQSSIVSPKRLWTKLEIDLGGWEDVRRFLKQFSPIERHMVTSRIQIVAFWTLFTQKSHAMPRTFFQNIVDQEPLAYQILDLYASVAEKAIRGVLMSIFVPDRKLDEHHTGSVIDIPPFVSPYGPSVLKCGFRGCDVRFHDRSQRLETINPIDVREQRTKHLHQVFGIKATFESQTGLPELTKAPIPPTSYHNTMPISIARTWAALNLDQECSIADEVATRKVAAVPQMGPQPAVTDFIKAVQLQICAKNHRGDIYSSTIEDDIAQILPSFLDALRVASSRLGLHDPSGLDFVHDWTKNTIAWKIEYELKL